MATYTFKGGDKLAAKLKELSAKANNDALLKVGFFEGSTESKTGMPSAQVAYINEFGGTVPARTVPAHRANIYRKVDKSGNFLNGARFTKKSKSNFVTEHDVPDHEIPEHKIPSRPFFRGMIKNGEKHWGDDLADQLQNFGCDTKKALNALGDQLVAELQESILAPGYVPLAPSTIKAKGNDQTLIDSNDMYNAVKFEVEE